MTEPGAQPWRTEQRRALLDFARRGVRPDGRFGWLTDEGTLDPTQPRGLYKDARTSYVWTLEYLAGGGVDAHRFASQGLASLADFADPADGGWYSSIDPQGNIENSDKTNYDHAHVLLLAATATVAELPGAADLLERASATIARWFWSDAGAAVETWNSTFTHSEPYRGANSNMHSLEAYLVAADVTGDATWRERGLAIADRIVNQNARATAWRIGEHYDENWVPLPDYNADRPADRFRPHGTTPGHSFEWSRLLLTLEAGLGHPPAWLLPAAVALFDTAVADGWAVDGHPGFVYTLDERGRPAQSGRLHWVLCEAILAAHALHRRTGEERYAEYSRSWWRHLADDFLDRVHGGWWQELTPELAPTHSVWSGKPDLYHSYQALLFPSLPLAPCAALALGQPGSGRPAGTDARTDG